MSYNVPLCRDLRPRDHSTSALDVPSLGYEMEELTWENGQLAVHRLGQPCVSSQAKASLAEEPWETPRAAVGTLESIVDQAIHQKGPNAVSAGLDSWSHHDHDHDHFAFDGSAADALVPCEVSTNEVGCSTRVVPGSEGFVRKKLTRLETRVTGGREYYRSRQQRQSPSASGSFDGVSCHVATVDTCQKEESAKFGVGTTPFCSDTTLPALHHSALPLSRPQKEESAKFGVGTTPFCSDTTLLALHHSALPLSRQQERNGMEHVRKEEEKKGAGASAKSTLSTKRSRVAATTHNQSERKRRDTINHKMKTLHKLVPNSTKTDKASILDEVIDYLKKLQSQQQLHMMMMSRMSMPSMNVMMPLAMPHPLMSMMPPMAMDMNMNTINPMTCPNPPTLSPLAFMPMASWDAAAANRLASPATMVPPDPTVLAGCHSQPLMMEAYSKKVALIQQQQLGSTSKIKWNS